MTVASFFHDNSVSILNGLALGMLIFILAVGLSLIFGLMDVLNLAHGAMYLLGTYLGYQLVESQHVPFIAALGVALVFGIAIGLVFNVLMLPTRRRPGHLDQVLLTLGMAFVVGDFITVVPGWGTDFHYIDPPHFLLASDKVFGQFYPRYRLAVMALGAALALVVYVVFERTQLGATLRASVEDPQMVGALGVNVRRVRLGVLLLGTALAAFAGVVGGPYLSVAPDVGGNVLLWALIVVVIGGLGSIPGAFLGAIIVGEAESLGVKLIPSVAPFALFGVMALVLVVRPSGLFAR